MSVEWGTVWWKEQARKRETMSFFENVFIVRPEVSAKNVQAMVEEFSSIVQEGGGKVEGTEYWGLRSLAYRIRKSRKAHYVLMHIDAPTAAMDEMSRRMRLHEDVLRFLNVRVDEISKDLSPLARSQNVNDEEGESKPAKAYAKEEKPASSEVKEVHP